MSKYQLHITTDARYEPERTTPGNYTFTYSVSVTNVSNIVIQIVARHWTLEDEKGRVLEFKGRGVMGKQPILKPGQVFQYSSLCTVATPGGVLRGHYLCIADDGVPFSSPIAPFLLDSGEARSNTGEGNGPKGGGPGPTILLH